MEKLDSKPISCKMFVSNQFGVFMMPPYHPGSPSGEGAGRTKKVKINCICKQFFLCSLVPLYRFLSLEISYHDFCPCNLMDFGWHVCVQYNMM